MYSEQWLTQLVIKILFLSFKASYLHTLFCSAEAGSLQFPGFLYKAGSLLGSANSERSEAERRERDLLFPVCFLFLSVSPRQQFFMPAAAVGSSFGLLYIFPEWASSHSSETPVPASQQPSWKVRVLTLQGPLWASQQHSSSRSGFPLSRTPPSAKRVVPIIPTLTLHFPIHFVSTSLLHFPFSILQYLS